MSRWLLITVAILVLLPVTLMTGVGGWVLWTSGHWTWLKWSIPVCWTAAWLAIRFSKPIELPILEIGSKIHWTPQDHAAASLIEVEQKRVSEFSAEQLTNPRFYLDRTIELSTEFARHYHPNSADPLGSVSVVEILTAVELATEDLEVLLRQNVPGSHLITVAQWRTLAHAPAWWRTATNIGWLISTVTDPTNLARYAISRAFVNPVANQLQTNALGSFYVIFVRQLGFYLIELNSGRLKGGSARYRAAMGKLDAAPVSTGGRTEPEREPVSVTIAVIGQVKAGKSSLINCLLGEQRTAVDVLPLTHSVQRYELQLEDHSDRLVLLDTPGYSDSGATHEQMIETREAVRNADLVLIVLDARSPAKQADISTLDELAKWFRDQNRLKPPPIVGVVSKIDGLSPVMEWSPPYSWESPRRPKETNIRAALEFVRTTFGKRLDSIVPVCSDRQHGRVFGIEEYLLPTISLLLDEARACSLVRSLHHDYDRERASQVVSQLMSAGSKIREFAPEFVHDQFNRIVGSLLKNSIRKQ